MLGPALPLVRDRFGVSNDDLGAIFLVYFMGLLAGDVIMVLVIYFFKKADQVSLSKIDLTSALKVQPKDTWVSSTFKKFQYLDYNEKFLILGLACCSIFLWIISLVLYVQLNWFWLFMALHIVFGAVLSFVDVSSNAIPASWPSSISGAAVTVTHFGFEIGAVVTPYVFKIFGLEETYFALGALSFLSLVVAIIVMVVLKKKRTREEVRAALVSQSTFSIKAEYKMLSTNFGYWCIVLCCLFYAGSETVLGGWISSLFIEIGLEQYSTLAVSLYWAGMLFGRLLFSSAQFIYNSRKKTADGTSGMILVARVFGILSIVAGTLYIILASSKKSATVMLVFTALVGISFSALFPLLIAITGSVYYEPQSGSTLLSVMGSLAAANIGAGFFPMGTGVVAERITIQKGLWFGVVGLILLSIALNIFGVLYYMKRKREPESKRTRYKKRN